MSTRDTKESFISKALVKWGRKYDYEKVNYVNSRTSIEITCRRHNCTFKQTPKAHFAARHHSCPQCQKEFHGKLQNEWRKTRNVPCNLSLNSPLLNQVFR